MRLLGVLFLGVLPRLVAAQTPAAADTALADTALAAQVARVVDSLAWNDVRDCCRETHLVLRPRDTWTLVRVHGTPETAEWLSAPADSSAFRRVAARLLGLGVLDWPGHGGVAASDIPTATLVLRLPGQCYQTTFYRWSEATEPLRWRRVQTLFDSLVAQTRWQPQAGPGPQWRQDAVEGRGLLYLCGL